MKLVRFLVVYENRIKMKNLQDPSKKHLVGLRRVLWPVCIVAVLLPGSMRITEPVQSRDSSITGNSVKLSYLTQCPSTHPIDCGDGRCCPLNTSCCGNGACCPTDRPHYCPSIKQCYKYKTNADEACGKNNWVVCGRPVG